MPKASDIFPHTTDPDRAAQIVNAAYGLVQGAFGDGTSVTSDDGHKKWEIEAVQDIAMSAARAFLDEIATLQLKSK